MTIIIVTIIDKTPITVVVVVVVFVPDRKGAVFGHFVELRGPASRCWSGRAPHAVDRAPGRLATEGILMAALAGLLSEPAQSLHALLPAFQRHASQRLEPFSVFQDSQDELGVF